MTSNLRRCLHLLCLVLIISGTTSCKTQSHIYYQGVTPVVIMCLGDSITKGTHSEGDSGTGSYPDFLSDKLSANYINYKIINNGQNGWTILQVGDAVDQWLSASSPNIILLQIGTNDLEQGASPETAADRLSDLIAHITKDAPNAELYVASVTRVRTVNKPNLAPEEVVAFNDMIEPIVKAEVKAGKNVVYVDLYRRSHIQDSDLGPDGEHPDDSGYHKMANVWFGAVLHHMNLERADEDAQPSGT